MRYFNFFNLTTPPPPPKKKYDLRRVVEFNHFLQIDREKQLARQETEQIHRRDDFCLGYCPHPSFMQCALTASGQVCTD